jgi:hypothetical protein
LFDVLRPILGVLWVAAVAVGGDHVWFAVGARNEATAGSMHGAALLGAVGLVLGWLSGRIVAGLLTGIAAGVGGALAYYAIAAALGDRGMSLPAMVAAWAAVWIVLAICDGRFLRAPAARSWNETLVRGVAAAVLGGLAFYFMFPYFWGRESRDYSDLVKFGAWAVAWAPGILSISSKFEVRNSK